MSLETSYLGFRLPHPLISGSSPMLDDLETARRLEDAGAAALVMRSIFEEQLLAEQEAAIHILDSHEGAYAEAMSFYPGLERFPMNPDEYLEQIRRIKQATGVPLFASLNGGTPGDWLNYAPLIEEAGADAVELNLYLLATDPEESGASVEQRSIEILRSLKQRVGIPVAVKLSPFYSAPAHFAAQLDRAGADGLVLFNRFLQPDIDVETARAVRRLRLSDPAELLLRLRWLAILSGNVRASLAATGGVHDATGAIKAVMAGAHAVQMVSGLLSHGPERLREVLDELRDWLDRHEYESLEEMQGSMSLSACPDASAYERANYMEILQNWKP